MTQSQIIRYGLVGSGRRTEQFVHVVQRLPQQFALTGVVTRSAERGHEVEAAWGTPSFRSIADLVAADRPDFVLVSVPWKVTPVAIKELVELGVPVLAETPPAPDEAGLVDLWKAVGDSGLVQVAEQYLMLPQYAAVMALLRSGALGEISWASVLSRGLYHSVSMLRNMLGVGTGPPTVRAAGAMAPLGTPAADAAQPPTVGQGESITALLDFADGRRGVYDFITNQWSSPIRPPHLVVRGSLGELSDDRVVRFEGGSVAETSTIERTVVPSATGQGSELASISLGSQVLFKNEYLGSGLSEGDLAIATLTERMGAWCRGEGPEPYSLAEASQDHWINLAIRESVRTGSVVETAAGPWWD